MQGWLNIQKLISVNHIYRQKSHQIISILKKIDKIQLPFMTSYHTSNRRKLLSLIKIISRVKEGEPQELIANIVLNGETLNAFLLRCRKSLEWFFPRKIAIDGKLSKFLSILKCLFYSYTLFDLLNYIPKILEGTAISICQLIKPSSPFRVPSLSLSYPGNLFLSRDFPTLFVILWYPAYFIVWNSYLCIFFFSLVG